MDSFDTDSGEIIDQPQRAADGALLAPPANGVADFIRMLENGQFDADVQADLRDLAANMQDQMHAGAGKVKAKLQITVEIDLESTGNGPIFYLRAHHKITQPPQKRQRSVAWTTEDNRFTPNMPRQGALFGAVRDVGRARPIRDVG